MDMEIDEVNMSMQLRFNLQKMLHLRSSAPPILDRWKANETFYCRGKLTYQYIFQLPFFPSYIEHVNERF